MEIFERLAFFGVRAIAPLYLVRQADQNGLGLSYTDKGDIYMWWALIQCLVPMVSGGFTERYGYRKSLVVAFLINTVAYIGMAQSLAISEALADSMANPGYWVFLATACMLGFGTAIFKPPVHGTIAKTTDEETSSMGWGVFYWVVNIGGALAPMCAAQLRGEINWHYVFYGAAIVTAFNFVPLFLLYKEPEKEPAKEGEVKEGAFGTFVSSIVTIFKDMRLVAFLLIFSCFWLMFMQLWDLLPNFIDEWVDTSDVAPIFAFFNEGWVLENGQTKPEMLINLNSISIIAFVLFVSWLIARMNKVAAMVIGMLISLVGFVGAGYTAEGIICAVMILVFSIGEMTCSPTFSAYVALIAPKSKKALYMGYSNIPFAIGWAAGNKVGGVLYEDMANKFSLARDYLVDELGMSSEFAMNEELLPNSQVMETMAYLSGGGDGAEVASQVRSLSDGVDWSALGSEASADKVQEIYAQVLGELDPTAVKAATQTLWDLHDPYMVWVYLGGIGLIGTLGMIIFYFSTRKAVANAGAEETAD
jgi:MFS family permease